MTKFGLVASPERARQSRVLPGDTLNRMSSTAPQTIRLPYGRGSLALTLRLRSVQAIPAGMQAAILQPEAQAAQPGVESGALIRAALADPIGSPPLHELAAGKRTATILLSDHTRPVPSREILPPLLAELRRGSPDIAVTLLVATGSHRPTTEAELREKLGAELLARERVVVHDCTDADAHITIGTLPSGVPLSIHRLAAETDLLLAEGCIEPHFFAGFSGGAKSVLPGVADQASVVGNHCAGFIHSPYSRAGAMDGNPIQADIAAAGRLAGLAFILNVVLDEAQQVVAAFAGEPGAAHRAGCEALGQRCRVACRPAEIVIAGNGGAPLDQNVYQCVKGLSAAEAAAAPGAALIMCGACADGLGGESFFAMLRDCGSPQELYERILRTPQLETRQDQWQVQILARILMKHHVIFVTRPELREAITAMKMAYCETPDEALARALTLKGDGASVAVIPNGVNVIVGTRE